MKRVIDTKQYEKALDLFEQQSALRTDVSINMAMRACIELQDYQRGRDMIKYLPSHSLNNSFIQTSLIRFYSKSTAFTLMMRLIYDEQDRIITAEIRLIDRFFF